MKLSIIIVFLSLVGANMPHKVFLEFGQAAWTNLFQDYIYTLKNHLEWTEKNVILRIYLSSSTHPVTGMIIRNFYNLSDKRSTVLSTTTGDFMKQSVSEKFGIAIANDEKDLKVVLNLLYYRTQHDYSLVCVTYPITNVRQNLSAVTSQIWTKGLSRNVFFITMSADRYAIVILRAPSYMRGYCDEGQLVEVGYIKDKTYTSIRNNFLPRYDNLGGCELNIMVQPFFVPYVVNHTSKPAGTIGLLVTELSKYLNFTPKYTWAYNRKSTLKHYNKNNLNILFDLIPRMMIPQQKYSFTFGLVKSAFVVSRSQTYSDATNLLNPFHYTVWICLAVALLCLTALAYIESETDFTYTFLKNFGVLLGIGGQIPRSPWIKLFFWGWLLPAYILQQSYLASLMKNMAIAEPAGDINTNMELINSNMKIVCTSDIKAHFCRSRSADHVEFTYLCLLCEQVSDRYIFKKLYPAAMDGRLLNNTSFVANQEVIKFTKGYRYVRFVRGSTISMAQTVSVRPGNPYIFRFQNLYTRCLESGLFEYWKRRERPLIKYKEKVAFVKIVNDKLHKCFYIIIFGWIISILAFLSEIVLYRGRKTNRGRCNPMSCVKLLGSKKRADTCSVSNGNGSSCDNVSNKFQRKLRRGQSICLDNSIQEAMKELSVQSSTIQSITSLKRRYLQLQITL